MDFNEKNAVSFLKELRKLEEKYGLHLAPTYEEEIDYDYEESPYVSGVHARLTLVDKNGFEIDMDKLLYDHFSCHFCGEEVNEEVEFCNEECKKKFDQLPKME